MLIFIFGPPGSGKGTYSKRIEDELGFKHISTGDFFRKHVERSTELGKKVEEYLKEGELVPDSLVNRIMEKVLNENIDQDIILDGFPRTRKQAIFLDEIKEPDIIVKLEVPEEVVIKRLSARRICRNCGEIYNLFTNPPEMIDRCDKCNGELFFRKDDRPHIVEKRIKDYKNRSQKILKHYEQKPVVEMNIEKVDADIQKTGQKLINKIKEKRKEIQ